MRVRYLIAPTGEKKGHATVIREADRVWYQSRFHRMLECKCDCGNLFHQRLTMWRYRPTKSCGCSLTGEGRGRTIHKKSNTDIYNVWKRMIYRCRIPTDPSWKNYGGRGITVCDRWVRFQNFYDDMGDCPKGRSLDRIDNNGPYSPENCRWATHHEQANNKRSNRLITAFGRTMTLTQWSKEMNISMGTISRRIKYGWSTNEAVGIASNRVPRTKHGKAPECSMEMEAA